MSHIDRRCLDQIDQKLSPNGVGFNAQGASEYSGIPPRQTLIFTLSVECCQESFELFCETYLNAAAHIPARVSLELFKADSGKSKVKVFIFFFFWG